jgi:hypothetical protein
VIFFRITPTHHSVWRNGQSTRAAKKKLHGDPAAIGLNWAGLDLIDAALST